MKKSEDAGVKELAHGAPGLVEVEGGVIEQFPVVPFTEGVLAQSAEEAVGIIDDGQDVLVGEVPIGG